MKRLLLLTIIALSTFTSFAQDAKDKPMPPAPYKEHPELPAFNILLLDSTTVINTYNIPSGKPLVIMNFMPDCEHCHKLTEKLLKGMDTLKNIRFYLVSPMELSQIRTFADRFKISDYPNIVIGKDKDGFCPAYYMIRFVPFLALYDKNKTFIQTYENSVEVKTLEADSRKKGGMPK